MLLKLFALLVLFFLIIFHADHSSSTQQPTTMSNYQTTTLFNNNSTTSSFVSTASSEQALKISSIGNFSTFTATTVKSVISTNQSTWLPVVISIAVLLILSFATFMVFHFKCLSLNLCKQQSGKLQNNSNNSAVQEYGIFSPQCSELSSNQNISVDKDYQEVDRSDRVMTINVLYGSFNRHKEVISHNLDDRESTVTSDKKMNWNQLYGASFNGTDHHIPGYSRSDKKINDTFDDEIYSFADANSTD